MGLLVVMKLPTTVELFLNVIPMFCPDFKNIQASPYDEFAREDHITPEVASVNSHQMLMVPRGPFAKFNNCARRNGLFCSKNRLYETLSVAFTVNAVTPDATVYVILAVFPEYATEFDNTGLAYWIIKSCASDAALSRPFAFSSATTTMLVFSVSVIKTVALVPDTDVVTPVVRTLPSDAFRTCTAVTPDATVHVIIAVFPEYARLSDTNTGFVNFTKIV
jgi:hypothetical protein